MLPGEVVISQFNATIALLNAYRPDVLSDVRRAHPNASAALEPRGEVMGNADDAALRDAAVALLDNASSIAEEAMSATFRKLRTARRFELGGSVLSTAGSAGVISALAGLMTPAGALPLAILTFVTAAVPLVTSWLRNTDGGASVAEALSRLREHAWDAQTLRGRIDRGDGGDDLVERVNELSKRLTTELAALGYPAAVRPI